MELQVELREWAKYLMQRPDLWNEYIKSSAAVAESHQRQVKELKSALTDVKRELESCKESLFVYKKQISALGMLLHTDPDSYQARYENLMLRLKKIYDQHDPEDDDD